jgi:hypothetical protein
MEIAAEVWSWVGPKATGTARFGGEPRRHGVCMKGSYPPTSPEPVGFRGRLEDTLRAAPSRLNTALEKDVVAVLYTGIVVFTDKEASQVRARRVSQLAGTPRRLRRKPAFVVWTRCFAKREGAR